MKVLLVGAGGQLGQALCRLAPAGMDFFAPRSTQLDICNTDQVWQQVESFMPALIINAAAYTAVDRAEQEPDLARAVNAQGPAHLVRAALACGARLFQVSTDYVFDGKQSRPYRPADPCHPLGVYGHSKLAGEQVVLEMGAQGLVMRTSWLYGASGNNFVHTMLRLMREREELGVVADQVGSPTSASGLAMALWQAADRPDMHGIQHWADLGVASWYDFAVAIRDEALALGLLERTIALQPIRTEEYPTRAQRPAYSVLDTKDTRQALGQPGEYWRSALRKVLEEMRNA